MLDLLNLLYSYYVSAKILHWKCKEKQYQEHLVFDRIQESVLEFIDNIAEQYFMANLLTNKLNEIAINPVTNIKSFREKTYKIISVVNSLEKIEEDLGIKNLLGNIAQSFNQNLALLSMIGNNND